MTRDAAALGLPDRALVLIAGLVGRPVDVTPLGGMSGARVFRATGPDGTVVAKGGASPLELAVYRELRSMMIAGGVRISTLHGVVEDGDRRWLVLEDVPAALPRDRWLADPEVMAMLARLHGLPASVIDAVPDRFRPAWTDEMDQSALDWLGEDREMPSILGVLRAEAAPLFAPLMPISGDPNPLNWGLSVNGELVLMDWERIGLGHPALDVAISIPGLPTVTDYDLAAAGYRQATEGIRVRDGLTVDARQLSLAKVWTVVEFLSESSGLATRGHAAPDRRRVEMAAALARAVPNWLRSLV